MTKSFYLLILILLIVSCQQVKKDYEEIDFVNNYKLKSELESSIKSDTVEPDFQSIATDFSLNGEHKIALEYWDLAFKPKLIEYTQTQFDSINNLYQVIDAEDFIIDKSKDNEIVIINESHHNASHRVFTESLLKKLFENGYTNLFLEALSNGKKKDTLLKSRKYPIVKSGYYTKNPQFGNLIRTALDIGYTIYPYETTGRVGGAQREIDQANNIFEIISENPNKKNLIHCGSGHALEGNVDFFGGLSLAGRLHKLTGIDPLTIDQVFYSEKSTIEKSNIYVNTFDFNKPSVLIDADSNPFSYENNERWIDIVIFHPMTKYINKRPNWLFENGNQNTKINISDLEIEFPIFVLAYKNGEDINTAVPIDIVEVKTKANNCHLALKKGIYTIVATNGKKSIKFEKEAK
ncbi:hypothetical protein ACFFVB_12690 [Formosa undariae]|uniref:Polysaccharide deacetylase n=1 Tax=Formosa undariae TaxID=1325436 RepID=A0ABV5F3B9_9FLAO